MSASTDNFTLARSIGVRRIHAYLAANGWAKDECQYRDTADIYLWQADDREWAIVPASQEYADYGTRIYQLAEQIGRLEGRHLLAVLTDLSLTESDLVRLRLLNNQADSTLRLADGVDVLGAAKNLVRAAACSTDQPRRMHGSRQSQHVRNFLDRVRLGQTSAGSFVVNILFPIAPQVTGQGSLFPDDPFERKVTRMLVSGLQAARLATERINRNAADISDLEDRLSEGISANLCQAVAELTSKGDGLEVTVSWAMTRPLAQGDSRRVSVAFNASDTAVLNEAARVLAHRQERRSEVIEGYVSTLRRNQEDPRGTATIKAVIDGKLAAIKAVFTDEHDYSMITQAHDARRSVVLEGDLQREGQRWHLKNPRKITVLDDEDY